MSHLLGDLWNRRSRPDLKRRERVAQVIGRKRLDARPPRARRATLADASCCSRARATAARRRAGEQCPSPLGTRSRRRDRVEQVDRPRVKAPYRLAGNDLPVDVSLLDQQRVAAHVADLEREQLLGDPQGW